MLTKPVSAPVMSRWKRPSGKIDKPQREIGVSRDVDEPELRPTDIAARHVDEAELCARYITACHVDHTRELTSRELPSGDVENSAELQPLDGTSAQVGHAGRLQTLSSSHWRSWPLPLPATH